MSTDRRYYESLELSLEKPVSSMNRRKFMNAAVGTAALTQIPSAAPEGRRSVSIEALDAAATKPVLRLDGLPDPVIIESIELLKKDREYFVRVRSKDGAQGVSLHNGRASYLSSLLKQRVIPYFIGKDARQLEDHLWGLYREGSNYKLQGLAFWSCQAWVEFAILDMLGRVSGKSIGALLGGVIRTKVPFYVASGRRDSTPEEEVDYLRGLIEETQTRAVKFRLGGAHEPQRRCNSWADARPDSPGSQGTGRWD